MAKTVFVIFCLFLLFSCSMPTGTELRTEEVLMGGLWSAWQIKTGIGTFRTPFGIKTINKSVQVVCHENKWYIWDNGYGIEIELIE